MKKNSKNGRLPRVLENKNKLNTGTTRTTTTLPYLKELQQ